MDSQYFHIVGAQRCGTTSLHATLAKSPNILMSTPKESKFFERDYFSGVDSYLAQYFPYLKAANPTAFGDARPQNLMIGYVPMRIRETFPNAKIIILLRHPILRAYSSFLEYKSMRPGRWPWGWRKTVTKSSKHRYYFEGDWVRSLDPMGGTYHNQFVAASMYSWQVENYQRGYYTGIFGYFDGRNLDSCVMIRFIENIALNMY